MSLISVKTKNNTSPQGKPRVYFSCHPADFKKYFETICADIFATQDCAVYYESDWDNAAAEGDLKSRLSDMQLFVVPITTKFLTENCRAKAMEYAFAMEQHIPVLPIAMEGGLAEIFPEIMNRVGDGYGDIQFLDRTSTDTTEIPYAEKLKNRLESVLIGNELAERVRAAFDAYIFLSYRKKDREKAKELMNLIHRIPYCRDIAIWYDEFLIPGEAWNQAIADALNKSKLVTLMVTPSIIEPGNFIIEHEYPDAIAAGKEVLPAEVVPTEREALFNFFEGLSAPFDGLDVETLTERLKALAFEGNDKNPEHNYLIGLAYLGAIDVERNPERAVELITSAAEAGLPEAMEKLSGMYSCGEGVCRDQKSAAEWMERCCVALENMDTRGDRYIVALEKSGNLWMELQQIEKAKRQFNKMLIAGKNLYHSLKTEGAAGFLASSLGNVGRIYEAEGYFDEAFLYYRTGLEIITVVSQETGIIEARQDMSVRYDDLGRINQIRGNLSEALVCYEKGLEISKLLADETGNAELKRNLAVSYDNVGGIHEANGNLFAAREYYEKGFEIRRRLAEETGTVTARRDLSVSYDRIGGIYKADENYVKALECYEKSLSLCKALVGEAENPASREDLAVSYDNVGRIYELEERNEEALSYFKASLEIRVSIFNEIKTLKALRNLSVSYDNMGRTYEAEELFDEALAYYKKGLEIARTLSAGAEIPESKRDLAISYFNIGRINDAEGKLKAANRYYEKALELVRAIDDEELIELIVSCIEENRELLSKQKKDGKNGFPGNFFHNLFSKK